MKEIQEKLSSNPGIHFRRRTEEEQDSCYLLFQGQMGNGTIFTIFPQMGNGTRILKGCLQTDDLEGKSWKLFTVDVLPNHQSDVQQATCILQRLLCRKSMEDK